ncbi:MAG: response regulator [Clostridiales bacterium]|nr:response regulator [Clostridiales bacterium]
MRKVMLVEDEELILQGVRNIIDWEALSMDVVHMAHNGREALALWEKEPVDLVVTDVEMPVMNGLNLLKELRNRDKRVRFVILTGYDEFEYARKAIQLDVEEYILKPIDEEKLEEAVKKATAKLDEMDQVDAKKMEDSMGWRKFLEGKSSENDRMNFLSIFPKPGKYDRITPALLKMDSRSMQTGDMPELLTICQEEKKKVIYLGADTLLLMDIRKQGYPWAQEEERENRELQKEIRRDFLHLQNRLESELEIFTFISIGPAITSYDQLPASCKEAMRMQKYRILDGYGSCVDREHIQNRKTKDAVIDESYLRKMILQKDQEGSADYIEDLFINNIRKEADVNTLYQTALKIAMLLWDIKEEYKLEEKTMQDLYDMVENIYKAEDIFGLKTIFISQISEIITYLHTETSSYTPVVKQIMKEVQENYRDELSLKTLAYKYHMNASYLGQIFQKEVGCSFAQYLSNTKNSIAKDLILNTNRKMHEIAQEVGYTDTSYFYRKFKQCYGVSPASLRDMKKY